VAAILLLCGESARTADAGVRSLMAQIEGQATALAEMIDSELGETTSPSEPQPGMAEIEQVVAAVAATARLTFQGRLVLVHGTRPAVVALAPAVLRRVLTNLVDNATRAAGPDGWVRISTRVLRSGIVVDVEDDGPGWAKIARGHGLGLAYVRETVEGLGGSVTARRTRAQKTQVRMCLPAAAPGR
jgi:signal transduction histidine kinase